MADPRVLAARLHARLGHVRGEPPLSPPKLEAHCYTRHAPNVCERAVRLLVRDLAPAALSQVTLQPFLCGLGTWVRVELTWPRPH